MKASELAEAIERAKAGLMGGGDPDVVLTEFAAEVAGQGGCSGCGARDLCFRCKVTDVLGEKATMSLPLLIPKVAVMIKEWHAERVQRKTAEKQKGRVAPSFRPGREPF